MNRYQMYESFVNEVDILLRRKLVNVTIVAKHSRNFETSVERCIGDEQLDSVF